MRFSIYLLFLLVCVRLNSLAQSGISGSNNFANPIQTAVPFLTISPDARSGALGDAGVAISPDGNSLHWNPSKIAFLESPGMLSLSYNPWLKNIVPNVFLSYGTFVRKLDDRNTFGAGIYKFTDAPPKNRSGSNLGVNNSGVATATAIQQALINCNCNP